MHAQLERVHTGSDTSSHMHLFTIPSPDCAASMYVLAVVIHVQCYLQQDDLCPFLHIESNMHIW